jgi:hypothetical protein
VDPEAIAQRLAVRRYVHVRLTHRRAHRTLDHIAADVMAPDHARVAVGHALWGRRAGVPG